MARTGWGLPALVLVALALGGCAGEAREAARDNAASSPAAARMAASSGGSMAEAAPVAGKSEGAAAPGQPEGPLKTPGALSRKIIYTGDVTLVAENLSAAREAITRRVAARGGYVAEVEIGGTPGAPREGHWKVRVPSGAYEAFMADLTGIGELQHSQTTSQDVSEEYYDVDARLSNKRVEEQRLIGHLRG
jgi:hypothetical protein